MSYKSRPSLTKQIEDELLSKFTPGKSKHKAKIEARKNKTTLENIYSDKTLQNYMRQCNIFTKYCKQNYGCKTIAECYKYVNEWLKSRIDEGKSTATLALDKAAVAKLYGVRSTEFIKTPQRERKNIKNSRHKTKSSKHFSVENHKDLIEFNKSVGLRPSEIKLITGDALYYKNGEAYLHVTRGTKGGKPRNTKVIGDVALVERLMKAAGKEKVFNYVPKASTLHRYRAEYACELYKKLARPLELIPKKERYICRKDMKGVVWDKKAMLIVSQNLGHERIDVIAGHYLYNL